jgi:hypothetical protein
VAEWIEPALSEPELKEAIAKAQGVKVELTV